MRNLKKVLSLSLALVMLLGLMVVGAGAATTNFSDADDINYTEAVDVMSAIGVFEGTNNGDFQPNGDLTREQAAKIITYMLLGQEAADKLGTLTAPYKDVPANKWSAGSIAYCANMGILAGDGNGYFYPTQNVTGYQFAKMLLVALGYDAEREGLVGSDWTINVSKLSLTNALDTGLDNGSDINLANDLTREEAAQMAFNTLKAPMVEYASSGSSIVVGDTPIYIGGSNASVVTTNNAYGANITNEKNDGATNYTLQFGERYFQNLTLEGSVDEFGRPAHTWANGKTDIGTYSSSADFTYTADCTSGASKTALERELRNYDFSKLAAADVFTNGKAEGSSTTAGSATIKSASDLAAKTGNGLLVEVYANNDRVVTAVVVVETELMQISRINTSNKTVSLKKVVGSYNVTNVDEDNGCYATLSGMKADDYVLVVPVYDAVADNYKVASVSEPTMTTGKITAVTTSGGVNKTITMNGEAYSIAKIAGTDLTGATPNTTNDYTLWLDSYGYAIYTDAVATSSRNIAFVVDTYQTLTGGKIVNMASVVWSDGTTAAIQVAGTTPTAGKAYTYTRTGNEYTLTEATAASGASGAQEATVNKTVALKTDGVIKAADRRLSNATQTSSSDYFNNYYANDVVFIYYNTTAKTVTVKEGIQDVYAIPAGSYAIVETNSAKDSTPVVSAVVIMGAASYVDSNTLIYVSNNTVTGRVTLDNKTTGTQDIVPQYEAYVDGVKQTITTSSTVDANSFYSYSVSEENGSWILVKYTATTGTAVQANQAATQPFNNRIITVNGVEMDISGAVVVDLRAGSEKDAKPVNEDAAGICSAINTYKNVNVSVIYDSTTGKASHVYLVSTGAGYTITNNGSTSPVNNLKITSAPTVAAAGAQVTVTVTAETTAPTAKTMQLKNGSTVLAEFAVTNTASTGDASVTYSVSFTMPASDVTLTLAEKA